MKKKKKKVLSKFTERRKKESKEERFPQDLLISRQIIKERKICEYPEEKGKDRNSLV